MFSPGDFVHFGISSGGTLRDSSSIMPNTGRFYAPTAAAAYRDRFMRPYSTVSAPVGGHAVAVPSPKLPANASYHSRTAVFRRAEEEVYGSPSSPPVYDNRVRGRPLSSTFDRQVEEERRYAGQFAFQEKQPTKQRAWAQEVASRLSTAADVRPLETIRRGPVNPARYITSMEDVKSVVYESAGGAPSTLPRLSSLLNRNGTADQFIDEERLMIRKRPRDHSPNRGDSELPAKLSRRFYDEGVADERVKYVESVHDKNEFSGMLRHEMPMATKNPAHLVRSHLVARRPVVSPPSSREYEGSPRYSYVRDDDDRRAPDAVQTQVRRARDVYTAEPTFRSSYEDESRGFESQRRGYYIHDAQQTHPVGMFRRQAPSELDSPRPTPVSRDAFSPVSRYSDSKEGERVIEAAADLVEERSPSKRESITKLLLKSKEFLKAKSLVRNRNNEIDWVATFLNVGFECNSIYSLMCPLRKGRWKVEEEKYTMELLRLIENGTIRLRHGQSIRGFIAKKLHSDDMRVLKKLSNCKMFHFARLINPRMSEEEEIDESMPNVRSSLDRLEKLKAEFLRSVQLEALVAVRKYLSDTSIRDLLNARD